MVPDDTLVLSLIHSLTISTVKFHVSKQEYGLKIRVPVVENRLQGSGILFILPFLLETVRYFHRMLTLYNMLLGKL